MPPPLHEPCWLLIRYADGCRCGLLWTSSCCSPCQAALTARCIDGIARTGERASLSAGCTWLVSNTCRGTRRAMLSALGRRLAIFIGESASSRVGWAFATIHALWFYCGVRSMGPPSRAAAAFLDSMQGADWTFFAGRPFHFAYQSWILKSVIVADIPSMLVQAICGLIL